MKISLTYLGTRNSKFRLNLTQRVTGSQVKQHICYNGQEWVHPATHASFIEPF